jgi:hypothetical protein
VSSAVYFTAIVLAFMTRREVGIYGISVKRKMTSEVVPREKMIGKTSLYHGKLESCRIY